MGAHKLTDEERGNQEFFQRYMSIREIETELFTLIDEYHPLLDKMHSGKLNDTERVRFEYLSDRIDSLKVEYAHFDLTKAVPSKRLPADRYFGIRYK